jgi:uncharacterized membrane protein YkoI
MRAARAVLLLVASFAAIGSMADAQELIDRRSRSDNRVHTGISLDQAVQMAQARYHGAKALKAETVENAGRRVHQIRLLSPEGKVWMVRVDAETGRIH